MVEARLLDPAQNANPSQESDADLLVLELERGVRQDEPQSD